MKACAQGTVKLEGKLRGSLSRQNANLGDPWTSLPLSFRTADSCVTGVAASQPWMLGYFGGMVDVGWYSTGKEGDLQNFKLFFVVLENHGSGD